MQMQFVLNQGNLLLKMELLYLQQALVEFDIVGK